MVDISIICLVYKSKKLTEAVYQSLYEHTPKLKTGEAELLFVANDPTKELVQFLREKKYPHIININERLTDGELFQLGYGPYEYIRRVYQGYNQGILNANGQKIVLINSDNFFSKDWLENLLKYLDYKKVVTATLIEPAQKGFDVFPGAIKKNFGRTLNEYKDNSFREYADKIRQTGFFSGGAYMPCLLYRDVAVLAGLYPEGNIAGATFDITDIKRFGDEFFYDKLLSFGVEHITAKDSIVYHLKEGEKSEKNNMELFVDDSAQVSRGLGEKMTVSPIALTPYIAPDQQHTDILEKLGHKFTIVIIDPNSTQDLEQQVEQALGQCHIRAEIVVMLEKNKKKVFVDELKNVKYVFYEKNSKEFELYIITRTMYGEYLLIFNRNKRYSIQQFNDIYGDKVKYIGNKEIMDNKIIDQVGDFIIPRKFLITNPSFNLSLLLTQDLFEVDLSTMNIKTITVQAYNQQAVTRQLETQRQFFETSTSWRITKPLRLAKLTFDTLKKDGLVATSKKVIKKMAQKMKKFKEIT